MSNLIWALLPIVLLATIYIFIFTRKGEFDRAKKYARSLDWITYLASIFGGVALASSLRASSVQLPDQPWWSIILVLLIVLFVIVVVRRAKIGRPIIGLFDERMQMIYAKSARNALFATYLVLFLHPTITELGTLDADWLSITIGSGLFVLLASSLFYYFRASS
ncbi:MAG TPA: hypothetical protein G4O18_09715 [Dehalococcoidia bacterium]|nr:hypothetical protein [Dehalococcoidia bacterium]